MSERAIPWPHAPVHRLSECGTYFVTVATYNHAHHFRGSQRLAVLQRGLLKKAMEFRWRIEAWAIFSNHYHFIAHSPENEKTAESLRSMLGDLHEILARWVNRVDETPKRHVWHNFWETRLTHQRSYLARLHYVHQNAVKHGLVTQASDYPWCSAGWFERTANLAQIKTIRAFKTDKLNIRDDYEPCSDW